MGWQVKQFLPVDASAPGAARTMANQHLAGQVGSQPSGLGADVALVLSELVTNAVLAGSTTVSVTLRCADGVLSVQVADDGTGWPLRRSGSTADLDGRGLMIVAAIADEWGAEVVAGGKVVWATFAVSPDAVPSSG